MIPVPTWALEDHELEALLEKVLAVLAASDDGDHDERVKDCVTAIEQELATRGRPIALRDGKIVRE